MKLAIDLFSGSGSFSKVARSFGYEVLSFDIRRRKGVCEPTIKCDINSLDTDILRVLKPELVWCGFPCDIFSYASGGFHLDKDFKPLTEKAKNHLLLLYNTLGMFEKSSTKFIIENPRGKLRDYPYFINWLKCNKAKTYTCTLSSYGYPTTKPTNLFSNIPNLKLLPLAPFGRGAISNNNFDNMTKVQRQKTPVKLIRSIIKQYEANQK